MKPLLAEGLGTFFLVFAGTGAIVANQASGGAITHVGIALTFGLAVMAMIHAFGEISGAHLNPAVTLGLVLSGRFPPGGLPGYALAQTAGAFAAAGLLRALFPHDATLGATLPTAPVGGVFLLEVVLTLMLMVVILAVTCDPKARATAVGVTVGGVVGLEALFAGPISGASMNPVRSLAPAVVAGCTQSLWIYLAAPLIGAALAAAVGGAVGVARVREEAEEA